MVDWETPMLRLGITKTLEILKLGFYYQLRSRSPIVPSALLLKGRGPGVMAR